MKFLLSKNDRYSRCLSLVWLGILIFVFASVTGDYLSAQSNSNSNSGGRSGSNRSGGNSDSSSDMPAQQFYGFGYRSPVGGLSIDAESVIRTSEPRVILDLGEKVQTQLKALPGELTMPTEQRKISLKQLNALLEKTLREKTSLPIEAGCLGGLTAIDYIVALPEQNDILLVGPAEGWVLNEQGTYVGVKSHKPVLRLEDLMTVMQSLQRERPGVISCSIDPTPEALQRFGNMAPIRDPEQKRIANEDAMGMMTVSFDGVPETSRLATVLAVADYRMKRLSLGFEQAPIKNMPSYPLLLRRVSSPFAPRFWLEPDYQTLSHDPGKLVWKLEKTKVKALTEREYFDRNGNRKTSLKKDSAAESWAKKMTDHFEDLAKVDPIFAEARNEMDLALFAAILASEDLPGKVGNSFDYLAKPGIAPAQNYPVPRQVPGKSLVRVLNRTGSYISATGGVLINPWPAVQGKTKVVPELAQWAASLPVPENNWWMN